MDNEQPLAADLDLGRRISNYLIHLQLRALRAIHVQVKDGTVVLSGNVRSFYEKQLCLNCSRRVAGVARLVDRIAVESPAQPQLAIA